MRTLDELRREYDRLDHLLGIDTSRVELVFSTRMVRRYGECRFSHGRPVQIRLASFLAQDEEQLLQTARHEYAHAAAQLMTGKPHGHDAVWKAICVRIGCEPERTAKPCPAAERRAAEYARMRAGRPYYLVTCRGCGASSRYVRRGKVVTALMERPKNSGCICRRCGGREFDLSIQKEEIADDKP